ncbi:MAG: M48 family metalloprotease [Candidatus Binatia bacterium]
MKRNSCLTVALCVALAGCGGMSLGNMDIGNALGAATDLGKAVTVTDEEVKSYAKQMRDHEEKSGVKIAGTSSKYGKRLANMTSKNSDYDGMKRNYKVFFDKEVNANASADGSVRVYTGLMDLMNDSELMFVIGHEIGHVKHGHTLKAMRTALVSSGLRKGAASTGGAAGALAASELGALAETALNARYSQGQETESDDYGLAFLRKNKMKLGGAETSLRKLAKLSGGEHSFLSSHPEPNERADRIAEEAKKS